MQDTLSDGTLRDLYRKLLDAWNTRRASGMSELFAEDGIVIGFDGSSMRGPQEIEEQIGAVFRDHDTGAYVHKIEGMSFPNPSVGVLTAIVAMTPAGADDIQPDLNALQTLVVGNKESGPRIFLFQNTPLALHGRPEVRDDITEEMRKLSKQSS